MHAPPPVPGGATPAPGVPGAGTLFLGAGTIVIGRDPQCALPLDHPTISWHHARFTRHGDTLVLEDLGSTNGTFVNSAPISHAEVRVGDLVVFGTSTFRMTALDRLECLDQKGMTLEVRDLTIDVPTKRLIENASLVIYPGELVGLMGPSGAGKTTLMLAMNGYNKPSYGQVLWNGQDLYRHYDQFRLHVGYVPQDDIMHGDLTVWQALYHSARLRLPADMRKREIEARLRDVLAQLGLEGTENVLIGSPSKKGISGGQRKRVNLAMELLTDPSVLFLDEPTSGLSSQDALRVMTVLRELADRGKTILLTIHQPSREVFRQMDNLVLLAKDAGSPEPGALAYFGPAYPESVHYFYEPSRVEAEPSPDGLLEGLQSRPAEQWITAYVGSVYKKTYVDGRSGAWQVLDEEDVGPKQSTGNGLLQWRTLVTRGLTIKARDLANTAILLAQAPIIAILIVFVFGDNLRGEMTVDMSPESWNESVGAIATTLFLLSVSALWFGCSNSAREIVAEWAVYHRERMINLGLPAYVGSKIAVLGTLCVVQCCVLLAVVHRGCQLAGPWPLMLGVLILTAFVGMAIGLLLSARAASSEVAISFVPLVLLPMVILGGVMRPPHKMPDAIETVAGIMASRWSFEAMLILESEERIEWTRPRIPGEEPSEPSDVAERYFPEDERSRRAAPVIILGIMLFLLIAVTLRILKSRDVHP